MQTTKSPARVFSAITAVAALAIGLFATQTAHADTVPFGKNGAIRGGIYVPVNSNTTSIYGTTFFDAGLDIDFEDNYSERNFLSVDYMERSKGSNKLQIIPVTIGTQAIQSAHGNGVRPYVGFGAGAYFINATHPGDSNFGSDGKYSTVTYGAYGSVGLQFPSSFFVDLRYDLIQPVKQITTEGPRLTIGVRF